MSGARIFTPGLALALLAAVAPGQDEASALASMLDRADVVAVVRTLAVRTEPGASIRVTLRLERRLKGDAQDLVTLEEPDGQTCGRALQGLVPGQRLLACLRQRGEVLVPCAGGGRGLPLATSAVIAHAQALLAADVRGRALLLVGALRADDARVAEDAALALALTPGIETAGAETRAEVVAALRDAMTRGARTTPSLLTAAVRLRAEEIVDLILPPHLDGTDGPFGEAFVVALTNLDPALTVDAITRQPLASAPARLRAVQLLRRLPAEPAARGLWSVLRQAAEPGVRVQASAALLRAGVDPRDLRATIGEEALATAQALAAPTLPRLRFVQPRSR